jgi:hypothetical protein
MLYFHLFFELVEFLIPQACPVGPIDPTGVKCMSH